MEKKIFLPSKPKPILVKLLKKLLKKLFVDKYLPLETAALINNFVGWGLKFVKLNK